MVVNLDGQGADELLAGYFGYPHARFESLISSGNFFDIIKLWKGLGDTFGNKPSMDLLKSLVPADIHEILRSWKNRIYNRKFLKEKSLL